MISQILMIFASFFDIIWMQFKARKLIYSTFVISAIFISFHYYFLDQIIASLVTLLSVFRFITCYFTTNKKFMYLFLILNLMVIILNFSDFSDILLLFWISIFIIWNFQEWWKIMRKLMMIWTFFIIIYNLIIFTPMWVIIESIFLISNIVWYYKHFSKN